MVQLNPARGPVGTERRRRRLRAGAVALSTTVVLLAGCSGGEASPEDQTAPSSPPSTPAQPSPSEPSGTSEESGDGATDGSDEGGTPTEPQDPVIRAVPEDQWQAMTEAGMVRDGCPITSRDELRRVDLDFVDFDGDLQRGHLVVNADTAETTARIFTRLLENDFPIARMQGVEAYDGDTRASLEANNTSAYNCRTPDQINAPVLESPHANGRAIDVNPVQNPWMDLRCQCWSPGPENNARTAGPGKVLEGGPAWQAFVDEGWIWQNIDVADYMHFDTGYPSVPYRAVSAGSDG